MKRALVAAVAVVSTAVGLLAAGARADARDDDIVGGPPTSLSCLTVFGTTGLLLVGGQIPTPGSLSGDLGLATPAPADVPLPARITFKDRRHAFSDRYAFALRGGRLYARAATGGVPTRGSSWRSVRLPSCLDGKVSAISADGGVLTVVGPERQLYTHDMPGGDLSPERWTWRWGPYLWTGAGIRLPSDAPTVRVSDFDADETFTDTAGRSHHAIGVMTGYLLRGDRRTITYIDPWLPADSSREVCGPARGTLPMASLDASGSTVFVQTRDGRLFTRLYDFDVSGANSVFGKYTWQRDEPATSDRWQLPAPGWIAQPRPPGRFTDRVTIATTGPDARERELRVEGRRDGRNGYWRKAIGAARWSFVATGERLAGRTPTPTVRIAAKDRRYEGMIGGRPAVVENFNPACSPTTVRVDLGGGARLDLVLHTEDAIRQAPRARDLNDQPKHYNAALVVPSGTWRDLDAADPRVRAFVAAHLDGQVTELPVTVTATRLRFEFRCWTLTLNGDPARPDAAPALDPVVLAGTLLAALGRQRLPLCP